MTQGNCKRNYRKWRGGKPTGKKKTCYIENTFFNRVVTQCMNTVLTNICNTTLRINFRKVSVGTESWVALVAVRIRLSHWHCPLHSVLSKWIPKKKSYSYKSFMSSLFSNNRFKGTINSMRLSGHVTICICLRITLILIVLCIQEITHN